MEQNRERGEREKAQRRLREKCAAEEELEGREGRGVCLLGPEWSRLELLCYGC